MEIQTVDIRAGFSRLVGNYLKEYVANPDSFLKILCNVEVPSKLIYEAYQILVKYEALQDISKLNQSEKMKLYNRFLSLQTSVPHDKKAKMCAIIYTLDFLKDNT